MCKVITFSNQKGGVGKTTSAVNFSCALVRRDYKVLLIDADPQGNSTQYLGFNPEELECTLFNLLMDIKEKKQITGVDVSKAVITHVEQSGQSKKTLDLIPSNLDLSTYESHVIGMPFGRERQLRKLIDIIRDEFTYDYIVIDASPALNLLNINVFTASDEVIIPIQAQIFSTKGLINLINFIQDIKDNGINPYLNINGILFTIVNPKTVSYRDATKAVEKDLGKYIYLYETYIHDSVVAKDAPAHHQSIFNYKKDSAAAHDYELFTDEYLMRR